jgi:glycosidase
MNPTRRLSALVLIVMLVAVVGPAGLVSAATFRNHIARTPITPNSSQSVTVWVQSDTAFGENAGLETKVGSTYTKILGTYDTSGPAPANWRFTIPAYSAGTTVEYQLFTRNQSGSDYGFTGFNWSYTVNDGDIQWDGLRHDTFDSYYRSPFGAVPAGTSVTLRFRTVPFDVDGVSVRIYQYNPATNSSTGPVDQAMSYLEDRVENGTTYAIWSLTLTTPSSPAILYYKFRVSDNLDTDWYSDSYSGDHDNLGQGGEGLASDNEPFLSYQLTVYDPAFATPEWLQNANVYQIFPDRFRNGDPSNDYCTGSNECPTFYGSETPLIHTTWNEAICDPRAAAPCPNAYGNQFYGGDLAGIEQKLDYLQSIGIDTIYLTPIFKARSNHRYDTDDYMEVDPALGGNAAFASLVAALEQRGMHVILDGVFNHTSSDSVYFDRYNRYPGTAGACESVSSAYRSWFEFYNSDAPCGSGDYAGWFGYESLAVLTDNSPAVRDYIFRNEDSVTDFWYEQGTGGWRFDVADEISHDWWREYRGYAKASSANGPLVGEVWPDASKFLLGDQLDSVMNYRFRKNLLGFARDLYDWGDNDSNGDNRIVPLSPSQFDRALKSVREDYPPEATRAMLNLIDSHDTNRALYVLSFLGEDLSVAKERLRLAALFQFTYLGAPMVYYGDEAAINSPALQNGVNGPEDDPYNRAPYPWADESGDDSVYGPADAGQVAFYTKLGKIRKQVAALRTGEFVTLLTGDTSPAGSDNDTYAYARVAGSQVAVVALNQGQGGNSASLPVAAYFADGTVLDDVLNGGSYTVSGGSVSLSLAARSGAILLPAPAAVDTTNPEASISVVPAPNGAGWNNSAVSVELSATDSGSGVKELRHSVNGGGVVVTSGASTSLNISSEGSTSVSLRAIDNAFNASGLANATVQIDLDAPSSNASYVDNGGGNATVTIGASDSRSGVASTSYRINGGAWQTYSGPFAVSGYGSYNIDYGSSDVAGNSEVLKTLSFTLVAPVTNAAVRPVLECVVDRGAGWADPATRYLARFGYKNDNTVSVTIAVGNNNKFNPNPINRGQPTSFAAGRQVAVFDVPFNGSNLVWSLRGPDNANRTSTASAGSKRCQ